MARLVAVHFWPVESMAPLTVSVAAWSRSASSSTTTGFLPPSSSCTLAPRRWAALWMPRPTSLEPVKEMAVTPAASVSAGPIVDPEPTTRLSTPPGSPSA